MEAKHRIRRHSDGSVDFDFYRREAFLLRRAVRRKVCKRLASHVAGFARPLVVLVIVTLAIAAVPTGACSPATGPSGVSAR
jgi:hypothetical protein